MSRNDRILGGLWGAVVSDAIGVPVEFASRENKNRDLAHNHNAIVLGAWGCGAFGNDPRAIAPLFHRALTENFSGAYRDVVFAVVDWSLERRFIGAFEAAFRVTIE